MRSRSIFFWDLPSPTTVQTRGFFVLPHRSPEWSSRSQVCSVRGGAQERRRDRDHNLKCVRGFSRRRRFRSRPHSGCRPAFMPVLGLTLIPFFGLADTAIEMRALARVVGARSTMPGGAPRGRLDSGAGQRSRQGTSASQPTGGQMQSACSVNFDFLLGQPPFGGRDWPDSLV